MPTKTDRILGYLPGTFRALPRPTALYSVVDAFGNELLQAENSLAAMMQSHWVDLADRNEQLIDDLARIASLYALAPRDEETVEEFREHLKRYVRTFLEGTVTVQGVLRVVAEVLGLHIGDAYSDMDAWWARPDDGLTTVVPRGDAAARILLGADAARVTGSPSLGARVTGRPDLAAGIDLRDASILSWAVDGGAAVTLDLAPHVANPADATLQEVTAAINGAAGAAIARHDGHHLTLASPTLGPSSHLEVRDLAGDAAPRLLGLPSRTVHGGDATSARVTGTVDLSAGVDLHDARYLRLAIDGTSLAEVDCAGSVPAATTLDQIRDAINAALGAAIASHDGHFLTLASTKSGSASSIAFQSPACQDATQLLFGNVAAVYTGNDAQPARLMGLTDLSQGVDLSTRSNVRLRIDGNAITVNCAGVDPSLTQAIEIIAAINAAFHASVANLAGRSISVASVKVGVAGEVALETPLSGDASVDVLGIPPRTFTGSAATAARLIGTPDLTTHQDPAGQAAPGVDLGAVRLLEVALDGGPPVLIDVRSAAKNPRAVTLAELTTALNAALGPSVASDDGRHLILTSPTAGAASSVEIIPLEAELWRRFVTRAFVTDEAARAIFGFLRARATGTIATQARVEGSADLGRGVDLRQARFLRVGVDGGVPIDIDCASRSARPRAALLNEIVAAINGALGAAIASGDGRHLFLTSPTTGSGSRIQLGLARGTDALDRLFGSSPVKVRGREGTRVIFKGTVDLSGGVDLSAAGQVKIGVDGAVPAEIACAGANPAHTTLNEIITQINVALGATVATSDGKRLVLTSPSVGLNSRIEFATPVGPDATRLLLGITVPRTYHGADPTPARVVGMPPLAGGTDLSTVRFLRIGVDGGASVDVDCAKAAADSAHSTLADIEKSINDALGKVVASDDGTHLILTSVTTGSAAQLDLQAYTASDARSALLGDIAEVTTGSDPDPAVITGMVDLRAGVNLAERRTLRVAVDGNRPVEIEVAGAAPEQTFPDEIANKINAVLPEVASVTDDNHLRLASPTNGANSRLELLPLRALELIEYPPAIMDESPRHLRHGDRWSVVNDGAADADLSIEISAPQGESGPELVNLTTGLRVRVMALLRAGERLRLGRDGHSGLRAEVVAPDGCSTPVPGSQILTGPLGGQTAVPFTGSWHLTGGDAENWASLQLSNPDAASGVILRATKRGMDGNQITVSVVEAGLAAAGSVAVADGSKVRLMGKVVVDAAGTRLVDRSGGLLALLRAASSIFPEPYVGRVVAVEGPLFPGEGTPPVMVVESIAFLFDVTLGGPAPDGTLRVETYAAVTIGAGSGAPDNLTCQLNSRPSELVFAEELDKGAVLTLPRGRSEWLYLNCDDARFDRDRFDQAHFAGGLCHERGVFDVSRFANPPEAGVVVFAPAPPLSDPAVEVRFRWMRCQPGAFVVNLPVDLPEEFGARFDQARFALPGGAPEMFESVVLEASVLSGPGGDPDYLVNRINAASKLVTARFLNQPNPPLGWERMTVPFRHPRARTLTLGSDTDPAKIYLAENGVPGLIELSARQPGVWGNSIEVTARPHPGSPARYDVTVGYAAARFESARQVAWAGNIRAPGEDPLPALTEEILRPQPVGVLHAKAAGVKAEVTRERADAEPIPLPVGLRGSGTTPRSTYLEFDGFSSYVEVPDSDKFSIATTGALTVSAWMKPDTLKFPRTDGTGYVHWLGKGERSGPQGSQEWAFRMYSQGNAERRQNRISFYVFNPEGHKGVGSYFQDPVKPGEWVHVVGVADSERTYIYKNGLFRKCDQYAGAGDGSCESHAPLVITPKHGNAPLRMGHRDGNSYFLGGLAEVRVWNRPLSRDEIADLYASNVAPRDGLVAEYLLNEGEGTVVHDSVGGNNGTIFGATWKSTSPGQ